MPGPCIHTKQPPGFSTNPGGFVDKILGLLDFLLRVGGGLSGGVLRGSKMCIRDRDTNLKAEAIDQLAREQAVAQARKMVQSATDETREIQNAHRLRLQDLKSRISEMEKTRGEMMDYLAKMIEELQKTQEYASQNAPLVPHKEELAEADAEPRLDLSANKVDAAASALRGSEERCV